MKTLLLYIRFFCYTAFHGNIWLAFLMLYHDVRGGLKYRISTFSPIALKHLTIHHADISKSSPYDAVNYNMPEKLLKAFRKLSGITSIVDLGCGKGRVMVVSAYFGFTGITGIDFAQELCREAEINMRKTKRFIPRIGSQIIHANLVDYVIRPEDSVFFMFNPFVEERLVTLLKSLELSCSHYLRRTFFCMPTLNTPKRYIKQVMQKFIATS